MNRAKCHGETPTKASGLGLRNSPKPCEAESEVRAQAKAGEPQNPPEFLEARCITEKEANGCCCLAGRRPSAKGGACPPTSGE